MGRTAAPSWTASRVVADPYAYGYLSKFIAVEITSTVRHIASEIALGEEEGLPAVCVADCDSLRTIPR